MTTAEHRNRQPKGVSTGGQYAAEHKPETPNVLTMPDLPRVVLESNLPGADVAQDGTGYRVRMPGMDDPVHVTPDEHIPDYWNATAAGHDAVSSAKHPNVAVDLAVLSSKVDGVVGDGLYNNVAVTRGRVVELVPDTQVRTRTETALELDFQDPNAEEGEGFHSVLVHPVTGLVLEVADAESGTPVPAHEHPEEYTVAAMQAAEEVRDVLTRDAHLSLRARQMSGVDEPSWHGDH